MRDGHEPDGSVLDRARAGDEDAFRALTDPYRSELLRHCYRILGSVQDAEDVVQETLLAAWRALRDVREAAAVRAWLYRIATNRCLNALRAGRRRVPAAADTPSAPNLATAARDEPVWVQPFPDLLLDGLPDAAAGPEAVYEQRESMELAFIVGLQHLPPRQRTVLVLRDVMGFRAGEVAQILDIGEAAVKSALARAREGLAARTVPARDRVPRGSTEQENQVAAAFAAAVEAGDIHRVVTLLAPDARLSMPPERETYHGRLAIGTFLQARDRLRGASLRVVPTLGNTQPALACYLPCPQAAVARPYGLLVLDVRGGEVVEITWFADCSVFPLFGLPRLLPLD